MAPRAGGHGLRTSRTRDLPSIDRAGEPPVGALGAPTGRVVEEVLVDFPRLGRLLDRQGGELSGGEQQLLALARCLCAAPKLVLIDEPTEGIQPSIVEEMVETLHGLRAKLRLTIVVVEQKIGFLAALVDRCEVIQKGAIVGSLDARGLADFGAVAEMLGMPAT